MLERVMKAKPVKPGRIYGAPGEGMSGHISLLTALTLVALWLLITEMQWVKPLFLPSPLAVWDKFVIALTEGVSNSTLAQHTLASLGACSAPSHSPSSPPFRSAFSWASTG